MKKVLFISAAIAAVTTVSNAADVATTPTFGGAYIGANIGMAKTKGLSFTDAGKAANDGRAADKKNSIKNSTGFMYGIFGGYGKTFNQFYAGLELAVTGDTSKTALTQNTVVAPAITGTLTVKKGLSVSLAPRFGYVFGSNMVYVKAGLERDVVTSSSVSTAGVKGEDLKKNKWVVVPGVGYERLIGKMFVRAEYSYNFGQTVYEATAQYKKSTTAAHRFLIGAGYQF